MDTTQSQDQKDLQNWLELGYVDPRKRADGSWVGLCRFMFTWAILSDLNTYGYGDRWCYSSYEKALEALDQWGPDQEEPTGWHRHPGTGRRVDKEGRVTINF